MSFFQNSVLNKHLKSQDEKAIHKAYEEFTAYYHDATRQQNIRESKEEQFQEGFLRELFVKILGYTLNPEPDFNLTTELKNDKPLQAITDLNNIDKFIKGIIIDYYDEVINNREKTNEFDNTKSEIIEHIKDNEYRQSLISDVVTGNIDVRGEV